MCRFAVFLLPIAFVAAPLSAAQGRRIAFVVANGNYQKLPALTSPAKEAELMADTLESAGFLVTRVADMRFPDFLITKEGPFLQSVKPGDDVVFYYSGYAVQGDDDNYLLPVDFDPAGKGDLEERAYHLNRMQQYLGVSGARLRIFILESARKIDTPILGSGSPGLMDQPDVGENFLFAFASLPGKYAPPEENPIARFTESVVKNMKRPGLRVRDVFLAAKASVTETTNGAQIPSIQENIVNSDFAFTIPTLTVTPSSLTFTSNDNAPPPPKTVKVYASGYEGKFLVSIPSDATWLSAFPPSVITSTSDGPEPNLTVSVSPQNLEPGQYDSTITISSMGSEVNSSPQIVKVRYTVAGAPKQTNLGPRSNKRDREEYVLIPAGHFKMGCVPGDNRCKADEKPQHDVTITRPFWMGRNEVEVGAYRRYISSNKILRMPAAPLFDPKWRDGDHPIVNVSWENARDYCAWAGGRLPTEAEWEYAARAGADDKIYPLDDSNNRDKANFSGMQGNDIYEYTAPVRKFDASRFGLYDMAGNVWEWVSDFYNADYYSQYSQSPAVDPQGPPDGKQHIRRGGSFDSDTRQYLRLSLREGFAKGVNNIGFRCVLDDSEKIGSLLDFQ